MKNILLCIIVGIPLMFAFGVSGQGLPPGWDFNATPSNHIIAFPVSSQPNINGNLLIPGDYIGVFYTNGSGELACGGNSEWLGDQNTGIIAFADDSFTTEKDGFASGEYFTYRYYSWALHKEYEADVICNDALPVTCEYFVSGGLSGVDTTWANGFYFTIDVSSNVICSGNEVQFYVVPSGGSGNYLYNWSSTPAGFVSTLANPVHAPLVSTTYHVVVADAGETLEASAFVEVFPAPLADAGPDMTLCEDSTALLNGQQSNGESFFWSTNGDGFFDTLNILTPEYTPGPADISAYGVQLNFTVAPVEPCVVSAISDMQLSIVKYPQLFVGNDQIVCENDMVNLNASIVNASQIEWATTGDGTFADVSLSATQYFPGTLDLQNGEVEIFAVAFAISPCQGQSNDSLIVSFVNLPQVNAGNNQVRCEDQIVQLSATASNVSTVLWQSSGDGTFDEPGILETNYYPGNQDIANGEVELVIAGQAISPCSSPAADVLAIIFIYNPELSAGSDVTICETGVIQLNANGTHFDEILWTTSGDGIFSDPNSLTTQYTPGMEDIQNNQAVLTIAAQPLLPCVMVVQDSVILSIVNLPAVEAGEDETICENENLQLLAGASDFQSIFWETLGDGTFDDVQILNPVYFAGIEDIQNQSVTLIVTVQALSPCLLSADDSLFLSIEYLPFANAGEDATIQLGETHQLQGEAQNYSFLIWSTTGDGFFDAFDILDPVYTPGEEDISNAGATLSLLVLPINACIISFIDSLHLTIDTITSINTLAKSKMLHVYPNPCYGKLHIEAIARFSGNVRVALMDETGKCMLNKPIDISGQQGAICDDLDISLFEPGIYILKLITDNNVYYQKILKLKH